MPKDIKNSFTYWLANNPYPPGVKTVIDFIIMVLDKKFAEIESRIIELEAFHKPYKEQKKETQNATNTKNT